MNNLTIKQPSEDQPNVSLETNEKFTNFLDSLETIIRLSKETNTFPSTLKVDSEGYVIPEGLPIEGTNFKDFTKVVMSISVATAIMKECPETIQIVLKDE